MGEGKPAARGGGGVNIYVCVCLYIYILYIHTLIKGGHRGVVLPSPSRCTDTNRAAAPHPHPHPRPRPRPLPAPGAPSPPVLTLRAAAPPFPREWRHEEFTLDCLSSSRVFYTAACIYAHIPARVSVCVYTRIVIDYIYKYICIFKVSTPRGGAEKKNTREKKKKQQNHHTHTGGGRKKNTQRVAL